MYQLYTVLNLSFPFVDARNIQLYSMGACLFHQEKDEEQFFHLDFQLWPGALIYRGDPHERGHPHPEANQENEIVTDLISSSR